MIFFCFLKKVVKVTVTLTILSFFSEVLPINSIQLGWFTGGYKKGKSPSLKSYLAYYGNKAPYLRRWSDSCGINKSNLIY